MSSFVKWCGGKAKGIRQILQTVGNPFYFEWREPFAGSAGAFFSKWVQPNRVWLNDVDPGLVTCYQSLCDESLLSEAESELPRLRTIDHMRTRFGVACCRIRDGTQTPFDYALVHSVCHGQVCGTRLSIASFAPLQGVEFMRSRYIDRLTECRSKLLRCGAQITCGNYERVIATAGEQVLLFVDPPYKMTSEVYPFFFTDSDHYRLSWSLRKTPHRFILTIGPSQLERDAYVKRTNWKWREREFTRSSQQHASDGLELVVWNF